MTIFVIVLVVLVVALGAMVARLQMRLDGIDFRTASTDNEVAGQHFRIESLEAAERARKELTK